MLVTQYTAKTRSAPFSDSANAILFGYPEMIGYGHSNTPREFVEISVFYIEEETGF